MDPKHQFAAQYVLSRAAAERRERETLLAAAVSASGSGLLGLTGTHLFLTIASINLSKKSSTMETISIRSILSKVFEKLFPQSFIKKPQFPIIHLDFRRNTPFS